MPDVIDRPVIGRCQLHKIRNVRDKLPEKLRTVMTARMRRAYHAEPALAAEAELAALAAEFTTTTTARSPEQTPTPESTQRTGRPGTNPHRAVSTVRGHDPALHSRSLGPVHHNEAERAARPVKIQQRTSGGAWRTLQCLIDFAVVRSYLDTPTKWGLDKLDPLRKLFTTGP